MYIFFHDWSIINMKNHLPDIVNRSLTPYGSKGKNLQSFDLKNNRSTLKSVRNISLSPLHCSSAFRKDSNETVPSTRAVSDEVHSGFIENMPIFRKLNTMTSSITHKISRLTHTVALEKINNYPEVVDALLSMYSNDRGRIPAFQLVQLFIGMGFTGDCEVLMDIFKSIIEGQSFNLISFSRNELLRICEDQKAEHILRILMKDPKVKLGDGENTLNCLIGVIRKWWVRLDKSQNGFVSFEEICKFYTEIGVIDTSSESKRIFLKFGQFGNYKNFCSVFAKALFKYLLFELAKLVKRGSNESISAEIAISTQRRKVILKSLEEQNNVIDAIIECSIYSN